MNIKHAPWKSILCIRRNAKSDPLDSLLEKRVNKWRYSRSAK